MGLAVMGPAARCWPAGTEAAVKPLEAEGYTVVVAAEGDLDGDGVGEVAVSLADSTIRQETQFMERSEAGHALPARVVLLKPDEGQPWAELPLSGGTGGDAAVYEVLAAVDLVADARPELFVRSYRPFWGNTGEGDAHIYAYHDGALREIWRAEGQSWRWARVAHAEVARACAGREVLVAAPSADPYHLQSTPQRFSLSAYGYRGDRYELLSQRLTVGRYRSADEAMAALGRGCRRF